MVRHIVILGILLAACETTDHYTVSRALTSGETVATENLALVRNDEAIEFPVAGEWGEGGFVRFNNVEFEVSVNCVGGILPLFGDPNRGLVCDQMGGPAIVVAERVRKKESGPDGEV